MENPKKFTNFNPWSSTPFYSHNQGYRLRIDFFHDPCTVSIGAFIIYCRVIRGEFDNLLKWPLKAVMKVALVNQQPRGRDDEFNIQLKGSKPLGDISIVNCGSYSFGSTKLDPYIRSGCFHIRIVSIQF